MLDLVLDGVDQFRRVDLDADVAGVALRRRDVAAVANDLRQVMVMIHPVRVDGYAAVAQGERAGVAVGDRLGLLLFLVGAAVERETDVAVRVDQSRHEPDVGGDQWLRRGPARR